MNQHDEIPEQHDDDLQPVDLGVRRRAAPRGTKLLLSIGVISGVGALLFFTWIGSQNAAHKRPDPSLTQIIEAPPKLTLSVPPPPPAPVEPPIVAAIPSHLDPSLWQFPTLDEPKIDLVKKRRLESTMTGSQQSSGPTSPAGNSTPPPRTPVMSSAGPMSQLQPLTLQPATASQLSDRNLLLTQGTMIDCVLLTRLVSTQPGMISCQATRDVLSNNGNVVLVDAGSKFIGYQQAGIAQGQARVFVVWSRLITPAGVTINLDSPGTGPLGEGGLSGAVDYHFGDRFSGAILVSLIGDLGRWASNRGNSGGDGIRFDNTTDGAANAVTTVLENSINIPPTLYKNQGERVGIFVARDLDFSSVYDLRPTAR